MHAPHTWPHTNVGDTLKAIRRNDMRALQLPLQGSNLDSPDPESGKFEAVPGASGAGDRQVAPVPASGHTLCHTHSHPCARTAWTEAEDSVLRRWYPHVCAAELVPLLPGRTLRGVYEHASVLGLAKSPAFLASREARRLDGVRGTATRFRPGHVPFNKDQAFDAGGRSHETRFRGGGRPHNAVAVGTRVQDSDGYWKVKVAEPKAWRWVHRMAWEDAHGPIPVGCTVIFRDGNRDHCDLANLALITRTALMGRNSIHTYPHPIPQLAQLRGALVDVERARAIAEVAQVVIHSARVEVDFLRLYGGSKRATDFVPIEPMPAAPRPALLARDGGAA